MKKSARRTLSLVLTLVLVCALAVVGFAQDDYVKEEYVDAETFNDLEIIVGVGIREYSAEAYVVLSGTSASVLQTTTIEADVGLVYTYCPENAMRPSNYITASKKSTLSKMDDSETNRLVLSTGDLTYGLYGDCVVLEATGNFVIDYTRPNSNGEYAPDPVHIVNDTI